MRAPPQLAIEIILFRLFLFRVALSLRETSTSCIAISPAKDVQWRSVNGGEGVAAVVTRANAEMNAYVLSLCIACFNTIASRYANPSIILCTHETRIRPPPWASVRFNEEMKLQDCRL